MEKEIIDRRRSWLWKKRNGLGDRSPSPTPVKLFDEQEVARILEDQKEQVDREANAKSRAINDKLDVANTKLISALEEITDKDNLVKQHIKVAEEAVIGWEKAENETAKVKLELEDAVKQKLATEDRVQHLDSALKEITQQLRTDREAQEQRIHEIIAKKEQEYEELKSKLENASHITDQRQAEMESKLAQASDELDGLLVANQALSNTLQGRSDALAEICVARTRAEAEIKLLQVRLEGLEKENFYLKDDICLMTERLESRMLEVEHAQKAADVASRQHKDALKRVTKLDEECTRLRSVVRKKTPGTGNNVVARLKQEVDPSGRDAGRSPARRRALGRTQSGADQEEENVEAKAAAEKIFKLQEETRTLTQSLGQRDEELQRSRIMCAKTSSRLSFVEEEVEALKLASMSASPKTSSIFSESSLRSPLKRDSLNFELMDDFEEMERMANAQSHLSVEAVDDATHQLPIAGLEDALAGKDRDVDAPNQMCHELSTKLAVAEEQLASLQTKNAANEQKVTDLQYRLDSLLESRIVSDKEHALAVQKLIHITEALAQATGTESATVTETSPSMSDSIVLSLSWQNPTLNNSMNNLVLAANVFLQTGADVLKFFLELTTLLNCILNLHDTANAEWRKEREEWLLVTLELESARVQVSELEAELCRKRVEQEDTERRLQVEMARLPQFEGEILKLKTDKNELESNLSEVDQHLVEANDRVESSRLRLSEAEALVAELRTSQAEDDKEKEEDLLEQELLELSDPGLRLAANMRASDVEMHQLHDKVATLEVELHGERRRHHEVVAKLEDLQAQIHRGVGRVDHSPAHSNGDHTMELSLVEDDLIKCARKEKEIAAAALAECQRTILALGKQLKVLGLQEPEEISQTNSIEQMTHTIESLRSNSTAPGTSLTWASRTTRPALPGLYYRQNNKPTDGPVLLGIEVPDSSNSDTTQATSPSPSARLLRSVRTIRGSTSMKASATDHPSTTSTFKRFYARSQSETSMSSDNSSPELVP